MRLFDWNGQSGSENTAVDSLGPRKASARRKILKVVKRSVLQKARSVLSFDARRNFSSRDQTSAQLKEQAAQSKE